MEKSKLRRMIQRHPKLMASCFVDDLKTNMRLVQESLQLTDAQLQLLTEAVPGLLKLDRDQVRHRLRALRSPKGLRLRSAAHARKVLLKAPMLLHRKDPEATFGLLRGELHGLLQGDEEKVREAILRRPEIFTYSHEHWRKVVSVLEDSIGLGAEEVCTMLSKEPRLLMCSDGSLETTAHRLRARLALSSEDLCRLLVVFPQALLLSWDENLAPKLDSLASALSLPPERLGVLLMKNKSLLGMSLDKNLLPKLNYLLDLRQDAHAVAAELQKRPRVLNLSLSGRIAPRLERVRGADLSFDSFSDWSFLELNDADFQSWWVGVVEPARQQALRHPHKHGSEALRDVKLKSVRSEQLRKSRA